MIYKLGDLISIKHGYAFKGDYISFEDNSFVLVTPGNFRIGGGFQEEKCKFYHNSDYPSDYVLSEGDLVVTMTDLSKEIDTLGYGALIPHSDERTYLHNQRIGLVTIKNNLALKEYIYWFLRTKKYQKQIASLSSGSTVHHTSPSRICDIDIDLPSIETQKRVVSILNSLENKINNNLEINKNLEKEIQAIYKSWFINFDSFGGKMPLGWKKGKLKDLLKLKRNSIKAGERSDLPYLPIDVLPTKSLALRELRPNNEAQSSLLKFDRDDILIGAMRVYFHRVCLSPCEGITRTTCFILTPYEKEYLYYGLMTCYQDSSIAFAQKTSKGSTMPYAVWDGGLGDMEILIPSLKDAERFGEIVEPLIRRIQGSFFENQNLKDLIDLLLPKLMSGEIDVSKVKIEE